MRVLIVDDERDLAETLQKSLQEKSFAVDLATDGHEGLFRLTLTSYDAAVLDVMLPGLDGFTVLRQARDRGVVTPVILLTARGALDDRVRGLSLGADDYLTKPFELPELVARLGALIRRAYGHASPTLVIRNVVIDSGGRRVFRDGVPVHLTAREYAILELLARSRGRWVSRGMMCEYLYDENVAVGSNVVDVHVAALRRKLGAGIIVTQRNFGYMVDV